MSRLAAKIPINRLLPWDLKKMPEVLVTALVVIIPVVLVVALNQIRIIRKTSWLSHYAGWYS